MPQLQVCTHGHRWNPATDRRSSVEDRWNRCPVCGGDVDLFSIHDTQTTANSDSTPDPKTRPISSGPVTPSVPGYDILGTVGHGGMGAVYRARHLATDRLVALKVVSSGVHASPSELARFRTETEAVRKIRHPQVVQVHDVGEYQGLPYVALELMDRGTLSENLGGAPLPPKHAAELVETIARGVQAAHDQGILHRDLKPANILLSTPPLDQAEKLPTVFRLLGIPKITDFGLAKRMDGEGAMTRTGAVMGTPNYMAPEQAEGKTKNYSPAIDVHGLGVILYEALTGRPPFKGATVMETLDQVRTKEPDSPDRVVEGVPRDLATICLKALAKEPGRRYPSPRDMADDLRRFLNGQTIIARPMTTIERSVRWVRKRAPAFAVLTAAVAIAFFGIVAGGFFKSKPKEDGTHSPVAIDPKVPTVTYFANLVTRRGVPEGIRPLTAEQVERRELSYRFTSRDSKVEMVEAIDRTGELTNDHNIAPYLEDDRNEPIAPAAFRRNQQVNLRPTRTDCRWEFVRNDKGELTKEQAYDRDGRMVWAFHYNTPTTGYYTDARGFPRPRAGSGAAYVAFDYSPEGWTTAIRYRDHSNKARGDNNDIFGRKFEHDASGLVVKESFLGPRDMPTLHPDGYAAEQRRYDAQGNVTEKRFLGLDGRLARSYGVDGIAREMMTYDADGHLLEWRAFDVDGSPARAQLFNPAGFGGFSGPLFSAAVIKNSYDERGRRTSRALFDHEDKPISGNPMNSHRTTFKYDDRGRCIEQALFNTEGKPTRPPIQTAYDDRGRVVETRTPAVAINSTQSKAGRNLAPAAPTVRRKYDDRGRLVEITNFTAQGKPTLIRGVHRIAATIDASGRPAEIATFDLDGNLAGEVSPVFGRAIPVNPNAPPLASPRIGPARYCMKWDERGNLIELATFAADGKAFAAGTGPIFGVNSVMSFARGWVPTLIFSMTNSAARVTFQYDDRGNPTEIAGFGADDKPVNLPTFDAARVTMSYDEHGKCTAICNYGPDGRRVQSEIMEGGRSRDRPSRIAARYDADGRVISYATFDAEDKPFAPRASFVSGFDQFSAALVGVARREWDYDPLGNLKRQRAFDSAGKLVARAGAMEHAEFGFDQFRRLTSIAYLDDEGQPVQTDRRGWARVVYHYGAQGRLTDAKYSDPEGKPVTTRIVIGSPPAFVSGLGIAISPADQQIIEENLDLPPEQVQALLAGPFDRNDELLTYDEQPVTSPRLFFERKNYEDYGSTKILRIRRGDRVIEVKVPSGPARVTELTASRRFNRGFFMFVFNQPLPTTPSDSLHGLGTVGVPTTRAEP